MSLTEVVDTTTPAGRMMMQIVGSFAEFERDSGCVAVLMPSAGKDVSAGAALNCRSFKKKKYSNLFFERLTLP
jgi:hypothetical protein